MKIEILIAIIIGVIIGLAGMFGVVLLTRETPKTNSSTTAPSATSSSTASPTITPLLKTNTTWDNTPIPFEGEVSQMPFVMIASERGDILATIENGRYSEKVTPVIGLSYYHVFSPSGQELQKRRLFSLTGISQNQPFLVGIITDLTQDGLQMRAENGIIEQIKFQPSANFTNIIKDPKKTTAADLAIGDRVVVVGSKAEKEVIAASAVVVIPSQDTTTAITLIHGKITAFTKNTVSIQDDGKDPINATLTTTTKLFGLKSDTTVRTRTKLIAKDTTAQAYAVLTASGSAQVVRSLFISE